MYPVDLLKVCISVILILFGSGRGWGEIHLADEVGKLSLDPHANLASLHGRSLHRLDQCGLDDLSD